MKKKILCFILAVIMLLGSLPLTAFANEARAVSEALPAFKISSQYFEKIPNSDEIIAIPDENGVFVLTISLTKSLPRPAQVKVSYEIENATAVVGTALTDDGKVENGDFLGAFVEPKYHTSSVTEEQHYGTSGQIWFPYNRTSVQIKIYSNTDLTDEDKTFKIRLTGVDNDKYATVSETEKELTCRLRNAPVAHVSSLYYQHGRALPDNSGRFYFNISLDRHPAKDEDFLVYYRTIDDSAVAEWGDYEGVGALEETYVTLNQANNYTATVTVQSKILDDAFYENWMQENPKEYIFSRKFIFELRYVEGNAILLENSSQMQTRLDCHLRAKQYHAQNSSGGAYMGNKPIVSLLDEQSISTPWCVKRSSYKADLNFTFPEYFKNYVQAGFSDVGVAIYGDCLEDWWNSDGPATFHLYYQHEGRYKKALTLYMEGEFDDSTFFGWELAFEYMKGVYEEDGDGVNIDDYMEDNFIGFTIYDNDEKVAFTTLTEDGEKGSLKEICEKLEEATQKGFAKQNEDPYYPNASVHGKISYYHLTFLKLPSNFILADSYRYVFESDTDDHKRKLDRVAISFYLMGKEAPKIASEESGRQMIATNIDQLKEGDPLRMSIRFDQPVRVEEKYANFGDYNSCKITALINGEYPVTLYYTGRGHSLDTLVFEGPLPEGLDNIKITSLTSLKMDYGSTNGIKAFLTGKDLYSKKLNDLLNVYNSDLRTAVATVSATGTNEKWVKTKSVDIYVWEETKKSRFVDYVTVYYEWSNSPYPPETYTSKLEFHTAKDKEIVKTIVGTGNEKMFLHLKTVSRYGKEKIETIGVEEGADIATLQGTYWFDNEPPTLELTNDTFESYGSLSAPTIRITLPSDNCGWQTMELYRKGDTTPLKVIKADDLDRKFITLEAFENLDKPEEFEGFITEEKDEKQYSFQYNFTILAESVGVGLEGKMERKEIEFYWIFSDKLGNVTEETARFSLIFDTNDYLNENEITSVGPFDPSVEDQYAEYESTTENLDSVMYIYDYSKNQGKNNPTDSSNKDVYYAFYFQVNPSAFDGGDKGNYSVIVNYRGTPVSSVALQKMNGSGLYVVWFYQALESGQYEIQLIRTEGDSTRVSQIYSVYATDGENDDTPGKIKVDIGTLLVNTVYQLSAEDPYFYYMDEQGVSQKQYYNNTKQPASFSSISKAKEYVYYMELSDIYLVQLTPMTATALNSDTPGYLKAQGETTVAQAGDYWIRYKSSTWEPGSNKNSWVYYYYGKSGELKESLFSTNLKNALHSVANRIVSYGKSVILTDTSLLLGTVTGDKMLDKYGMPFLYEGQVHAVEEISYTTLSGSTWSLPVVYAEDNNIYRSNMFVGEEGSDAYREYPIVGNFSLSEDSWFQYMNYEEFSKGSSAEWWPLNLKTGETFVDFFTDSGIYYIREISKDGVAVYPICIDKTSPSVEFYYFDLAGNRRELAVDGVEIQEINAREVIIGNVFDTDRLSYISVYNTQLKLVAMHNAEELAVTPLKLENGKYYIVVSDRSGNYYTVTAKVSSTTLQCQIKESADRFIKLTCNRREDEILRYEVYRNGQLVTSAYSADQNFTAAGTYKILIQDIYGNTFAPEEYIFHRNYPEVTWKYRGEDGKYHNYDPKSSEANGFIMTQSADNQYKISTSVETRFSFSGSYGFEFIGVEPKHTKTVTAETTVTIEAGQSFTLKVYYKDFTDNYVIFSGVVDVTPPSVSIVAETNISRNGEYSLFDQWLRNGKIGDVIDLEELYYSVTKDRKIVNNGETVSSSLIKIDVSDANALYFVEVYLDGVLIRRQDTGFSQIVVSRWGKYRIVAKDALGNVSEVTFSNGQPEHFDYLVDGEERDFDLHSYSNFEQIGGKMVYTKSEYGNSNMQLNLNQNAEVFLSVAVTDGETKIYGFRIEDGSIYPLTYTIVAKNDGAKVELQVGAAILSATAEGFVANKEYLLNKDGLHAIYASISEENLVTIKVYAPADSSKIVSVTARLGFEDNNTMFVSTKLSKKTSKITFKDAEGKEIVGFQTETDIRANKGFTIDESLFEFEFVSDIKLYFSKLNDLEVGTLNQRLSIYESAKEYESEGFYLLVVRNRFGNERIYRITISRSFGITSSVTFGDGVKTYYSKDYKETLYSNHEITIDILDENVTCAVTISGIPYYGFEERTVDGITYLIFSQEGCYEVTLVDSYGNSIVRRLEINKSSYKLADDLLTGYNEKALKRSEGYTNQKLTVNQAVCDRDEIYYLAIKYGETVTVLLDAFSENPIKTDAKNLIDIIGHQGDGVYTVICRNRYGSVVTKDIHYRSTPTLKLERTTRSKTTAEIYDLNSAVSLGFWSNNSLMFSTEATTYIFTINGSVTECPRTLLFESSGEYGNTEYEIVYVDEYGFEYKFKAYLVRKNVTINLSPSISGVEVNGVLNTKNDICITFDENTYATYTRNNGEEVNYRSGEVLKKDGTYKFTVMDYAGNVSSLTIKKDTVVEFAFVESNSGAVIQNGSVVNSSKIGFDTLNKDSAYIEKVLRNGVIQTDFEGSKFTDDGKWELILGDALGNKAYFSFYIVTRAQNGFAYTTPYESHITELWFDSGDGVKISYMNFVNHTDFTSAFDFIENGTYSVVMTSDVTGAISTFKFTVNTNAPDVSLVGCNVGETTINDVTLAGCKVGDRIKIYRETKTGEELVEDVVITTLSTKIPTITEGGKYRVVVESEAGVPTELTFVRKHVMNTAGSIFIMVVIGLSVIGLFTGLVYRNKSKIDD